MQAVESAAPIGATVEMERVWDGTTAFVRANPAPLLAIAVLTLFVPGVLAGLAEAATSRSDGGAGSGWMLVRLVAALLTLWGELAIVALAIQPRSVRAALGQAGLRLPVVIGFAILLSLVSVLLAVPAVVILSIYSFDFVAAAEGGTLEPEVAATAWIILYTLVLLPVLLWIGARLSLVLPVVVGERRGLRAISRSFRLTRGLAAKIIGMLLLYGIVSLVLTAAVRFGTGTIFAIAFGGDDGLGAASVLTLMLTAAVETVMAVLLWAFTGKLYLAARERYETAGR